MKDNELLNITKVIETSSSNEVNHFLEDGWKLIDTYRTTLSIEANDESIVYVLGRTSEKTP